ncbi:polycystic kidney disease protein 1-like 3 isoform X2 [Zootermopsis nevadensis]|uniref:polycystic kidney disease protein 1-like 3 isoform X2 n=1 Tax=Zootermopsis nevadensis TaxID=136037 RepID=UPI000B8E7564|nr:polycystic kidney disease protein 1-like 3 isoform X2 [Zootermopsis nevadensis]
MEGFSFVDLFSFHCDYPEQLSGFPLKFEVYQTPDPSHPETEILISYPPKPEDTGLVLMAGKPDTYKTKISLRIKDHSGEILRRHIADVTVKPMAQSPGNTSVTTVCKDVISGIVDGKSLGNYIKDGDFSGAGRIIAAMAVAMDTSEDINEEDKRILKEEFINALDQIPVDYDSSGKQVVSVLNLVLGAGNRNDTPVIPHGTILTSSHILENIMNSVYHEVTDPNSGTQMSSSELMNTSRVVMDTMAVLLSSMTRNMNNMTASTSFPESMSGAPEPDYPAYHDLDPTYIDNVESYKTAFDNIVTANENIGKAILHQQGEEQKEKVLDAGPITTWIKVDKPKNLADKFIELGNSGQGVKVSKALAKAIENNTDYVRVQVTVANDNPLQWDPDSKDINTGLMLANIWNRETNKPIDLSGMSEPIDLYVTPHISNKTEHMAEGKVTVPVIAVNNTDLLEDYITVHRIPCKKGQTPYLKFSPLDGPFSKLQVVVTAGVRPSLEHFEKYSETVPRNVSSTEQEGDNLVVFVDGVSHLDDDWCYAVADTMDENDRLTIDYSFQIRTLECHVWNMKTMSWDSSGCYSGNETTLNRLHCRCTHFGGFSGTVLIPSSNVDPVLDIDVNFISASSNTVILFFVLTILVVYFLIHIWTHVKDKQDISKNEVIILGDNCPGDSYPYLVAVYTGYQRNAGTSSVVGIKLVGDKDKSMNHILVSGSKAIHSRSSDNFFVLLEARRLGSISYISLWHNCSGHHAAW